MIAEQPDLFSQSTGFPKVSAQVNQIPGTRIFANGYDVTDRMPLTRAVLEAQAIARGKVESPSSGELTIPPRRA